MSNSLPSLFLEIHRRYDPATEKKNPEKDAEVTRSGACTVGVSYELVMALTSCRIWSMIFISTSFLYIQPAVLRKKSSKDRIILVF